jgi:hypothetical protein
MKKNLIIVALLSCAVNTYAQNIPGAKIISGPNFTTVTGVNGDSQTAISMVPGVSMQTPWWINNMATIGKDVAKDKSVKGNEAIVAEKTKIEETAKTEIKNKELLVQKEKDLAKEVEKLNSQPPVLVGVNNVKDTPLVTEKRMGQVAPLPTLVTNDISIWNKSSLQEMTELGKKKTQESYLNKN